MNTKELTTAALMVALSIILALIMYIVPFLQVFVFLVGLPIVLLGVKFDFKLQLLATVALGFLMAILDPFYGLSLVLTVAPMSILQGLFIKQKRKNSHVIFAGTIAAIFGFLSMIYLVQLFLDLNVIQEMTQMFDSSLEDIKVLYASTNLLSDGEMSQVFDMMGQMKDVMLVLIPSAVGIYAFVMSLGSFIFSRLILNRMKLSVSSSKFSDFRIDKTARNTLMIVLFVVVAASYIDKSNMTFYILNAMSLFIILMQINGFAYTWFLTKEHPNRRAMRMMIVALFIVAPLFGGIIEMIARYGMAGLGFLDMYFNFRLKQKRE